MTRPAVVHLQPSSFGCFSCFQVCCALVIFVAVVMAGWLAGVWCDSVSVPGNFFLSCLHTLPLISYHGYDVTGMCCSSSSFILEEGLQKWSSFCFALWNIIKTDEYVR